MTAGEMIECLKTLPPDTIVIHSLMSEYCTFDPEDFKVSKEQWIERNGSYMPFTPQWWDESTDGPPKIIPVCVLPGN